MNLNRKIIYGLERLSDAFKSMLWEKAKTYGISPIQIQILLFVDSHKPDLCNISMLAREFNVTKPTISDAVKVLIGKGYLEKDYSEIDNRRYNLNASTAGKALVKNIAEYSFPIQKELGQLNQSQLESLFETLSKLIYSLNQQGILEVQRTCFGCRFYQSRKAGHYCSLLEKPLANTEIRLDCAEFEDKRNSAE